MKAKVTVKGSYAKTKTWLDRLRHRKFLEKVHEYGKMGVDALSTATPKDTGLTSQSWDYEIHASGDSIKIVWVNRNLTKDGIPIAILIQYGHGTGTGGYVQGRDYINPALRPVFDKIANEVWAEAMRL